MISLIKAILVHLLLALPTLQAPDSKEWTPGIQGYHFHVYFNHTDPVSIQEAIVLRKQVRSSIERGILGNCRLNVFNYVPVGPHPGGSYETCCNASSMANALSFFMENRGNLTILLHPLTRYEIVDHTDRAMFLGEVTALKLSALSEDLGTNIDHCAPFDFNVTDPEVYKGPRSGKIATAANLIKAD